MKDTASDRNQKPVMPALREDSQEDKRGGPNNVYDGRRESYKSHHHGANMEATKDAVNGWEWDLLSVRFVLLMLFLLATIATYVYMSITAINWTNAELADITSLVFRLATMTTGAIIPFVLAPAVCQLGQLALPQHISVSKNEVIRWIQPPLGINCGIVAIHIHMLVHYPWGIGPTALLCLLNSLAFLALLALVFAWMHEFRTKVHNVGQQQMIGVSEADEMMAQFEQLKASTGNIMFILLSLSQVIMIFSIYNVLSGRTFN